MRRVKSRRLKAVGLAIAAMAIAGCSGPTSSNLSTVSITSNVVRIASAAPRVRETSLPVGWPFLPQNGSPIPVPNVDLLANPVSAGSFKASVNSARMTVDNDLLYGLELSVSFTNEGNIAVPYPQINVYCSFPNVDLSQGWMSTPDAARVLGTSASSFDEVRSGETRSIAAVTWIEKPIPGQCRSPIVTLSGFAQGAALPGLVYANPDNGHLVLPVDLAELAAASPPLVAGMPSFSKGCDALARHYSKQIIRLHLKRVGLCEWRSPDQSTAIDGELSAAYPNRFHLETCSPVTHFKRLMSCPRAFDRHTGKATDAAYLGGPPFAAGIFAFPDLGSPVTLMKVAGWAQ